MPVNTLGSKAAFADSRGAGPLLPRCVFAVDEPFFEQAGEMYCGLTWWRFGDRLASHARAATLYVPMVHGSRPSGASPVRPERLRIEARFFYSRTEDFYIRYPWKRFGLLQSARRLFADHDLVVVRTPSPLALPLARTAWQMGKPTVMFVAGDVREQNAYARARGLKAALARHVAGHLRRQELAIAKGSVMVAVWGHELLPVFAPVNTRTAVAAAPNMSRQDIHRRSDTATGSRVRLVRVARLLPSKGLESLLEAVALLRNRGYDVCLDVAGSPDQASYRQQLVDRSGRLAIEEQVRFHGAVEFGAPLFDLYRAADIHVVSSLAEGLPRCIVEGRAMGLPTIATRVGGIPTVVHHGLDGLLIEPDSPEQIAQAVERLIQDGELRRRIIAAGYQAAETQTAEFQAGRLAALISTSLRGGDISMWATDLCRAGPEPGEHS